MGRLRHCAPVLALDRIALRISRSVYGGFSPNGVFGSAGNTVARISNSSSVRSEGYALRMGMVALVRDTVGMQHNWFVDQPLRGRWLVCGGLSHLRSISARQRCQRHRSHHRQGNWWGAIAWPTASRQSRVERHRTRPPHRRSRLTRAQPPGDAIQFRFTRHSPSAFKCPPEAAEYVKYFAKLLPAMVVPFGLYDSDPAGAV